MKTITKETMPHIHTPERNSHKGQNGRLLIIGGSHLFHAASLWSLTIASRIVDLVHYASVPDNNEIVLRAKEEFRNGMVIEQKDIEVYIEEDDVILIGPGMVRTDDTTSDNPEKLGDILSLHDEGKQTLEMTRYLLKKYPHKQWVIDAGALQMLDISIIPLRAILTPHHGEWNGLWEKEKALLNITGEVSLEDQMKRFAEHHHCIILVKGEKDNIVDGTEKESYEIAGGNVGMTKGGTGDVLAGLIAALACKNDPLTATLYGSYFNKKAGDKLFERVGPFYNASDLANELPRVMNEEINTS